MQVVVVVHPEDSVGREGSAVAVRRVCGEHQLEYHLEIHSVDRQSLIPQTQMQRLPRPTSCAVHHNHAYEYGNGNGRDLELGNGSGAVVDRRLTTGKPLRRHLDPQRLPSQLGNCLPRHLEYILPTQLYAYRLQ